MVTPRLRKTAVLFLLFLCAGLIASSASANRIYPSGVGDGYVHEENNWDSYSEYATIGTAAIDVYYAGDGYHTNVANMGIVEIPLASLYGSNVSGFHFTYSFFVLSATIDDPYYKPVLVTANVEEDGVVTVDDYNNSSRGSSVMALTTSPGWKSVDVTSYVQSQLAIGRSYASFVFSANGGANHLSIAAVEDSLGRGSYLNVIPEPSSLLALLAGISGLGGMIIRHRK